MAPIWRNLPHSTSSYLQWAHPSENSQHFVPHPSHTALFKVHLGSAVAGAAPVQCRAMRPSDDSVACEGSPCPVRVPLYVFTVTSPNEPRDLEVEQIGSESWTYASGKSLEAEAFAAGIAFCPQSV